MYLSKTELALLNEIVCSVANSAPKKSKKDKAIVSMLVKINQKILKESRKRGMKVDGE